MPVSRRSFHPAFMFFYCCSVLDAEKTETSLFAYILVQIFQNSNSTTVLEMARTCAGWGFFRYLNGLELMETWATCGKRKAVLFAQELENQRYDFILRSVNGFSRRCRSRVGFIFQVDRYIGRYSRFSSKFMFSDVFWPVLGVLFRSLVAQLLDIGVEPWISFNISALLRLVFAITSIQFPMYRLVKSDKTWSEVFRVDYMYNVCANFRRTDCVEWTSRKMQRQKSVQY